MRFIDFGNIFAIPILMFGLQAKATDRSELFDGIKVGVSEKGYYYGLFKEFEGSEIDLGLNYLDSNIYEFTPVLVDGNPVYLENLSLVFSYSKFLRKNSNSGPYLKFGADVGKTYVHFKKDLSQEVVSSGKLTFTCSACGILSVKSDSDSYIFIPSVLFGYKKDLGNRFTFNTEFGAQYFVLPSMKWKTDTTYPPPSFISSSIDEYIDNINESVNELKKIIPTLKVVLSYRF